MSRPLVFQAGVRDEIDEAYTWYEKQRLGLGEEFLTEVESVLDRIERNPEIHAPVYKNVRHTRLKRFPYAVHYRFEPDRIAVVAIHHGKRDPRRWQSRA
jgi:plasmid stabilization system protein ParE